MEGLIPRSHRKKVFRDFDCLCSALAINCCQFSCCIPDVPENEFPCENRANQWMAELIKVAPKIKLRDLIIPGTHDSASYSLSAWTLFSAAGRTQNVSVYEQLMRGARYLDIRVAGSNQDNAEDVYVYHGCLRCARLEEILKEIKVFMDLHPQEFVFCEIVAEYGRLFTDEQKLYTLNLVQETFEEKIYKGKSYNQLMNQWSLAQVVTGQKKTMCVMVHPRIYKFEVNDVEYLEDNIMDEFGFVNSHRWMRSHWHNTRDIEMLKQWNLEEVKKYGKQDKKMLNNQIVMTPGVGSPLDVAMLLLGGNSIRPVSYAAALYKSDILDEYFRENCDEPWNMVMLDYIDLTPALVCFLISLNFPPSLTIMKAAVTLHLDHDTATDEEIQLAAQEGSWDVTNRIQKFLKRGRALYLTDVQKDLELSRDRGTLTIAYKMKENGKDNYRVTTIDFSPATEVVLSPFCRNEENTMHCCVNPSDYPNGGCIKNGMICPKEEGRAVGHHTIIQFATNEANECEFGIAH